MKAVTDKASSGDEAEDEIDRDRRYERGDWFRNFFLAGVEAVRLARERKRRKTVAIIISKMRLLKWWKEINKPMICEVLLRQF